MTKICDIYIEEDKCYYKLHGCYYDKEFEDILDFKSWEFKSWKTGKERKYFSFSVDYGERVFWTYIGFAPVIIRYLQQLGYIVNGKELFNSKDIILGPMRYNLWDFQSDAVNSWVDNGMCGIIKSPTGSGKTVIACEVMKKVNLRTLISVHTSDLLINVWFNNLIETFGLGIKDRIGIIGGGLTKNDRKDMRLSCDCSFEYNISKSIVIATAQSVLNKLDLLNKEKFGLVVYDEVHHYSAEQFRKVASAVRAPYKLGLSATLSRPDGTSPLFYGLLGGLCFNVSIRELVRKGVLVEPVFETVIINDEAIQTEIASCGLKQLDLSKYIKKLSSSSVIKKDYIINLAISLKNNNKKFIMYTDFVSQIDGVFTRDNYVNELQENGIRVVGVSSEYSGKQREQLFDYLRKGKLDGLIFGSLGSEGVNIPAVDSVIMCNVSASPIRYPQRVGRAMRGHKDKKYAYIYEILLDIPKEIEWSQRNFYEYHTEGYIKNTIRVK